MTRNTDTINSPGYYLEKKLLEFELSQSDLAKRTGLTTKTINKIIKGTAPISPDTAVALEVVLHDETYNAKYWLDLESKYQIYLSNKKLVETQANDLDLLVGIDLSTMIKEGWIIKPNNNETDKLKAVLSFFGVSSKKQLSSVWHQLDVNYRTSEFYKTNIYNIMLWLRRGELLAKDIDCKPYDMVKFKKALSRCRKLTTLSFEEIRIEIKAICSAAGVAVVIVPELKNISTSGAAQWLSKDKALIQLSNRGKKDDKFWHNFFHEACHILYHGRKGQFLDTISKTKKDRLIYSPKQKVIESEADAFAAEILVPSNELLEFIETGNFTKEKIIKFSKKIKIAPGIVVGQLQHLGIVSWGSPLQKLKITYKN